MNSAEFTLQTIKIGRTQTPSGYSYPGDVILPAIKEANARIDRADHPFVYFSHGDVVSRYQIGIVNHVFLHQGFVITDCTAFHVPFSKHDLQKLYRVALHFDGVCGKHQVMRQLRILGVLIQDVSSPA